MRVGNIVHPLSIPLILNKVAGVLEQIPAAGYTLDRPPVIHRVDI